MDWLKNSIMMTKGVGKDSKGETHHLTEKKTGHLCLYYGAIFRASNGY